MLSTRVIARLIVAEVLLMPMLHFAEGTPREQFSTDFTVTTGREPTLSVRLSYRGDGTKIIFFPTNYDFKVISPGKWTLKPRSEERVVVTGTGAFGTQPITTSEPVLGEIYLKDYFCSATPGKNNVTFEFPLRLPNEKETLTMTKTVELELTAEQAASVVCRTSP